MMATCNKEQALVGSAQFSVLGEETDALLFLLSSFLECVYLPTMCKSCGLLLNSFSFHR